MSDEKQKDMGSCPGFPVYSLVTGEVMMAIGFYSEVLKIRLHALKEKKEKKISLVQYRI